MATQDPEALLENAKRYIREREGKGDVTRQELLKAVREGLDIGVIEDSRWLVAAGNPAYAPNDVVKEMQKSGAVTELGLETIGLWKSKATQAMPRPDFAQKLIWAHRLGNLTTEHLAHLASTCDPKEAGQLLLQHGVPAAKLQQSELM